MILTDAVVWVSVGHGQAEERFLTRMALPEGVSLTGEPLAGDGAGDGQQGL